MKQLIRQPVLSFNLPQQASSGSDTHDGFDSMRDWQISAFQALKDVTFMVLNAPMGSGKSWMMCVLSIYKMKRDNHLRTIIAVPQTIIAPGFLKGKVKMPDGECISWYINHNLCNSEKSSDGTVNYIINWLTGDPKSFNDRTIICTHATLVTAYKRLKLLNRLFLFKNLLVWIDEAHHVKNVTVSNLNTVVSNCLGELVSYLLRSESIKIEIGLTTASFFRGDRCSLLTTEMESSFKRFNLPYDQYFKSMKYLKSFSMDFVLCGSNPHKAIELLLKHRRGNDIVYIPHPTSRYSSGDKYQEVNTIIATYGLIHGENIRTANNGLTILSRDNNDDFKILDLVSETKRSEKKQFLNGLNQKDDLDAVIALGMFKEGANWKWADRSIIVGPRSSLVDIIQMVGRLFRDVPGKEHVEVFQLLPFAFDQQDEDNFTENLNNYLKALYASLILENVLNPVKIKMNTIETRDNTEKLANKPAETGKNWLEITIPDDSKQLTLIEDISTHLINISTDQQGTVKPVSLLREEYNKVVPGIFEKYGVTQYQEEVARQVWNMLTRRSINLQGIAVEDIDFEILQNTSPLDCLVRYTSGVCNVNTLQKLREAIAIKRGSFRPFFEAKLFVHDLCLKSESEWQLYITGGLVHLPQLPADIPKAPWAVYKENWISMGDFLGTNRIAPRFKKYASYEEAKEFAKSLNLKGKEDWFLYCKGGIPGLPARPDSIPVAPDKTYKRKDYGCKWINWGDFLGTNRISTRDKSKSYRTYENAQLFVEELGLKTAKDWRNYLQGAYPHLPPLPPDIPKKPDTIYAEWSGWPIFLGAKMINKYDCHRLFLPFGVARDFVHKLGLKNQKEWQVYCRKDQQFIHLPPKPIDIPSNPQKKYEETGWQGYADWLGY